MSEEPVGQDEGTIAFTLEEQATLVDHLLWLRKLATLLIRDRENRVTQRETPAATVNEIARLRALLEL